jgi:hypothetical protein
MNALYGTRAIRRERRTRARVEQLDNQIIEVLVEDHPQSIRHVFYRMTDPRLPEPVEKSDRGYRHVQHRLCELRRAGQVPYGWITDTTRRGYFVDTYRSAGDFLHNVAGLYRADLWNQTGYYVEIWVESRSVAGVIQRECKELAVSLYPAGGFASWTLAYEAAENINAGHDGRKVIIFYIGDYDPAGVLIDVSIEQELRKHLDADVDLHFERIGITAEQIAEHELPTKPRKEGDKRSPHIKATVEAEALPAYLMRELVRSNIEALLPPHALAVARAAEESEQDSIRALARLTYQGGAP